MRISFDFCEQLLQQFSQKRFKSFWIAYHSQKRGRTVRKETKVWSDGTSTSRRNYVNQKVWFITFRSTLSLCLTETIRLLDLHSAVYCSPHWSMQVTRLQWPGFSSAVLRLMQSLASRRWLVHSCSHRIKKFYRLRGCSLFFLYRPLFNKQWLCLLAKQLFLHGSFLNASA